MIMIMMVIMMMIMTKMTMTMMMNMMMMLTSNPLPIISAVMQPIAMRVSTVRLFKRHKWWMSLQIAMCVSLLEEAHNRADNSTEKRVRLKGTASVIGQFRRDVIGPLSVKPWGYWLWWLSLVTCAFRSVFLLRLSIHLFLIKLSICHWCVSICLFVTVEHSFAFNQIVGYQSFCCCRFRNALCTDK